MSTDITINVSFLGNDHQLGMLVRQARGRSKPSGGPPEMIDEWRKLMMAMEVPIEFNQLVPLPDLFSKMPYIPQGQSMEYQSWGVVGGAFAHVPLSFEEGSATYQFDCTGVPFRFFETVSRQWPGLWIVASYGGEAPIRGRLVLYQGAYLEQTRDEGNWLQFSDRGDAYVAWVDHYLRYHNNYIEYVISKYILKN